MQIPPIGPTGYNGPSPSERIQDLQYGFMTLYAQWTQNPRNIDYCQKLSDFLHKNYHEFQWAVQDYYHLPTDVGNSLMSKYVNLLNPNFGIDALIEKLKVPNPDTWIQNDIANFINKFHNDLQDISKQLGWL